jgi:glycosyltransferase involved in cell wall biosynthesis
VAVVLPAYNESAIIEKSLQVMCDFMKQLEPDYDWEIIVVNDGSADDTGARAETFAQTRSGLRVLHHPMNFGMGQAIITGFKNCSADFIVTMDLDLSFSPSHIPALLERMRATRAKIVVASPYARGGKMSRVPWHRQFLSTWANRFLARASHSGISSLTGVMRVYDGRFLRSLDLKSLGMGINPEIVYKAMVLQARIEEIPAHLDWSFQSIGGGHRRSKMRLWRQVSAVMMSGFLFRPVWFFVLPGVALFVFAVYVDVWMFLHFWDQFERMTQYPWFLDRASHAVAAAFREFPHTFTVGLFATTLAVQLLGMGILALQSKMYFEDGFHLGTSIYQKLENHGEHHS